MSVKPGRYKRFAKCLDVVAAWLRRREEDDPLMRTFELSDEEWEAVEILEKTKEAMFLYCGGDVLDCLEDAEKAAMTLEKKR